MARKVYEAANFVFAQLIAQEPGIYDKRNVNYARQDKIRGRLISIWLYKENKKLRD
jgi:hypothetical protein